MSTYRLLITQNKNDDFRLSLDVPSTITTDKLHDFIKKSLNITSKELASFHICDDEWQKLQEITLIRMIDESEMDEEEQNNMEQPLLMKETKLNFCFTDFTKMIYNYDLFKMITFYIDLIKVEDKIIKKAVVVENNGKANFDGEGEMDYLLEDDEELFNFEDEFDEDLY